MLTARQEQILEAIIMDYVQSVEPVGSRTLSKKYDLGVSAATIRNEMSDLEEFGFIIQPHTSAGRVPSDEGYRYYVDHIMQRPSTAKSVEANPFYEWLSGGRANDDATRQELLRRITELSRNAAILFLPENPAEKGPVLAMLNLLYLSNRRALMVVVTDDEQIINEVLDLPPGVQEKDVAIVNGLLNHYLRGLPAEFWAEPLRDFLMSQEGCLAHFIREAINRLGSILNSGSRQRIYLEGVLNMLEQPEFQDVARIRGILTALEDRSLIPDMIGDASGEQAVIRIGAENHLLEIEDCGLVITPFQLSNQLYRLALLGPKRMDYAANLRLLTAAVNALEALFGEQHMLIPERSTDLAPLLHSFAWQLRDTHRGDPC